MAELAKRSRRQLGEMLHAEGLITRDQLNRALEIHRATGERLGNVLLDMGVVGQEQVARMLSQQLGAEFVRLTGLRLSEDLLRLLPAADASRLQAIPIANDNGRLTVAMVDPLDVVALDDIRRLTRMEVRAVVTTVSDFQHALNQYPEIEDPMQATIRTLPDLPGPAVADEQGSLETERREAEAQPIVRLVSQLIEEAVRNRATDIHVEPQGRQDVRVRYRIDGILKHKHNLPRHVLNRVVSRIKILGKMDIAERRVPQDGSFQTQVHDRAVDIRVSTVPSYFGEKVVMRLLDKSAPIYDLDQLGISPHNLTRLRRIVKRPQGLFLLTGPTGSGKTTTLYAVLNEINNEAVNIVTIEDPVEYQIRGVTQVQVNPRAGVTFSSTLRHFLRQDPDLILVGEIRDEETARIAVQAALTGHLVLSTLHTNDAMGAVTRLLDMKIEPYLVAASLAGVAAQRLVRVLCPRCRQPDPLSVDELRNRFGEDIPEGSYLGPQGCDFCNDTGYRGRVAIFEIAEIGEDLRHLIVNNQPAHLLKERARSDGMTTLLQDGFRKAAEGRTSVAEVERVVYVERANGNGSPAAKAPLDGERGSQLVPRDGEV
ncbi:MAG: Flp pilus assembly complex ATPase component TadA [Armatimonadetes bacterium]|nr:Flp pilus assembly complex ATPase component TadA [Armatimonadota bacterium]